MRSFRTICLLLPFLTLPAGAASLREDGDKAFEAGDCTTAAACYSALLSEKPDLARDAAFMAQVTRAKAGAACESAERLMAGGNGAAALAQAEDALKWAPDWERAKQVVAKARRAAADDLVARAFRMADQARPDEVQKQLAAALQLIPDHPKAVAGTALLAQKPAKDSPWEAAQAAAAARDWAGAEMAWREVLGANADHFPARLGAARARQAMAGATKALDEARVALAAGRLGEAQVLCEKAVVEWPLLPAGKTLQADVAARRAEAAKALDHARDAVSDAKFGKAEAAYREALAQDPSLKSAQVGLADAVLRLADDLAAHGRPGAALLACRRSRGVAQEVDRKAEALARQLRREEMPRFKWKVEGDRAEELAKLLAARGGKGAPEAQKKGEKPPGSPCEVGVRVVAATISRAKTGSEAKTWKWASEKPEANPDYQTAQTKLEAAEDRWNQALKAAEAAQAVREGHRAGCTCDECVKWRALSVQAQDWGAVVADLLGDRNRTPRTVVLRDERAHPYAEETWEAKGRLAADFILPGGEPERREAKFDKADTTIVGARPEIGLAEKKLDLPGETAIFNDMAGRLLEAALPALTEQAVLARAALLKHAAAAAQKAGDADGALELRAKAAALLGAVSEALMEKELKALE